MSWRLPRFDSLRLRLLVSLLAVLACAVVAVGGITYRNVLQSTQELFDYQLRQMALTLREQGSVGGEQAQVLTDEGLDFVVQVWTVDGRSVFATRSHEALPSRAVIGFADVKVDGGGTWRTYSVVTESLVIQVAQPLQIRQRLAAGAALRSVVPLLILAPVLGLAVWWLIDLSLAPLRRVAGDVRRRDASALSPVASEGLPDEARPLVASINALLARVAASFDAQRAFVADAAHELRSPLTALKLQVQVLRRASDPAAREAAIATLGDGVDRASRLVDQLLALARSEAAGSGAEAVGAGASAATPAGADGASASRPDRSTSAMGPVLLHEVAREALVDTVPYALSRGSQITLDGDEAVTVVGDRAALAVLVRNLADNAVRYSPPGSTVRVFVGVGTGAHGREVGASATDTARVAQAASAADAAPVLIVDDPGPGIPESERARVLDRFYRRDSTAADAAGTGLGLAIVKNIAARHGASLLLTDSPLGGLRVAVRFGDKRGRVNTAALTQP